MLQPRLPHDPHRLLSSMIVRVTQTVLCSSSLPSSLDGVRVGMLLQGSGHCRLRTELWAQRLMCPTLASSFALACSLALAPLGHTPVFPGHPVVGGGAVRVTLVGRCHQPWVILVLRIQKPQWVLAFRRSTYSHTGEGCGQRLGACMCSLCVRWCIQGGLAE